VGADGLRHEVFWNDFDAWFTDAGVEVYTAVTGAAVFEQEERYPLGQGGSALQVAPIQRAGEYTVSGYARLAYPSAWGIEGSFGSACAPWRGVLEQALTSQDVNNKNSETTVQNAGGAGNAGGAACVAVASGPCMSEGSSPPVIGGEGAAELVRPPVKRVERLSATRGLLYALDETGIVLQTPRGYATYYFTQAYSIARHTVVLVSELRAGDVIDATVERSAEGALAAVALRVYRDQAPEVQAARLASAAELASVDQVAGVFKELSVQANRGGELRVSSGGQEVVLKLSPLLDATVIRPASFADISAVPGYVSVVAAIQDDGTQSVRAVELHW
jgi:hypothetical protein